MCPPPVIQIVNAATTVSGPAAAGALTQSAQLKSKVAIGVIAQESKRKTLSLYRSSSTAPGYYSRDVYRLVKRQWRYSHKDRKKHPQPPIAPQDAFTYSDGPLKVWTMKPLTQTEKNRLRKLLVQGG